MHIISYFRMAGSHMIFFCVFKFDLEMILPLLVFLIHSQPSFVTSGVPHPFDSGRLRGGCLGYFIHVP
jgi:hypothetical protein